VKSKPNGKVKKLRLLLEFSKRIVAEKTSDGLLALLAEEAKSLLAADRCTIFILDKNKKILWSKVAQGSPSMIAFPWDKGIAGEAARTGKTLNIKNARKDSRFNPQVDRDTGYRTKSILTTPMKNLREEVQGVFQVLNKTNGKSFNKEDEELLAILARQAGAAVENVQLYEQVLEAAQDTIFRLAAAAEYKDKDTGEHILRMSRYTALIAEEMGFPPRFCENLRIASSMHDIGKLGVPDAILGKPASLNETEWVEMRKHTLYGAEILKDSTNELIKMSHKIALSHHEKFDGSGYPSGLKGEAIPIEGRITALADVFDALTSKRAYKEKFSMKETLRIIRDGVGKHFDPKVGEAFERVLPKMVEILHKHSDPAPAER